DHWRDIKHTDLMLINGANPAQAHPVGFQWFLAAKNDPKRGPGAGGGAKIIHADPRFTRTSAMADIYARIRVGTDVAYFGGLINYVLQNNLFHDEYVRNYTNASFLVKTNYSFKDGLFSGYDPKTRKYDISSWGYQIDTAASDAYNSAHPPAGGELSRAGAVLQLLLGNMGRPGGGMNAERGHANIQGNTDHAISWEILPGYMQIPAPQRKTIDEYVAAQAPKKADPHSWNFF